MPRKCFVIMPFSATDSCTEEEWTEIFDDLFKPAIEDAGLDYECIRSEPTRGNMFARIIRELSDSYLVLADLTDGNTNVFYELGIRHSLRNRSIIVAQNRNDFPFDIAPYASHVYDHTTEEGRSEFTVRIRKLLEDVDSDPDRSDNPVSDFLGGIQTGIGSATSSEPVADTLEVEVRRQSLIGPGAVDIDPAVLAVQLARSINPRAGRNVYMDTRQLLLDSVMNKVEELNQREPIGSLKTTEIPSVAKEFISEIEGIMIPIEQFGLMAVREGWPEGVKESLKFASDLLSLGERPRQGRNLRFALGLPQLLAFRFIALIGTKALIDEQFDLVEHVLRSPIEVQESTGQFSHRSFIERRNIFYPEAFLGHADYLILYMRDLWSNQPHLADFFDTASRYEFELAQFLLIVALADAAKGDGDRLLYPGYKLLPQTPSAISAFVGRISGFQSYKRGIARIVLLDSESVLDQRWEALASKANSIELGSRYWPEDESNFPVSLRND